MSITREQVADLREGDVVCVTNDRFPDVIMQGPLRADAETNGRRLMLGATVIRCDDRSAMYPTWNLTVISRAPRPLYVNHDRTEPAAGDVVRDKEGVIRHCTVMQDVPAFWSYDYEPGWQWTLTTNPLKPLTLLVDGETGQVVQP